MAVSLVRAVEIRSVEKGIKLNMLGSVFDLLERDEIGGEAAHLAVDVVGPSRIALIVPDIEREHA